MSLRDSIIKVLIKEMTDEMICLHCGSAEIKCLQQYEDKDEKINTVWRCRSCRKKFKTRW